MEMIFIGLLFGALAGFVAGLAIAITTPNGIWPNGWAVLIMISALVGALIGSLEWMLS